MEIITKLGAMYNNLPCNLSDLSVSQIKSIRNVITDKFLDLPCNVEFEYGNKELDSFEYVKKRYFTDNVLLISADNNNSELLPANLNLWLRAWHDYIHISNNYLFGFEGEFYAFLKHIEGQSDIFKQVLFSEIVMQTAYFETYGTFAEIQKVVILPIETVNSLINEIKLSNRRIMTGAISRAGVCKARKYAIL
jgi:hypothetical protein